MPPEAMDQLERRVLEYLRTPGRSVADSRARVIGEQLDASTADVHAALRVLELREPALVMSQVDAGLAEQVWFTTPAALDVD